MFEGLNDLNERVLGKMTVAQLVKKSPGFVGTRRLSQLYR
jgi:hypothetical protein